jgi:transposase-like protein
MRTLFENEFNLPYNPAYGLDNSTRVEVLRLVVDWRLTVKQAARIYKLNQSTVYRWVADVKKPNTQGAK